MTNADTSTWTVKLNGKTVREHVSHRVAVRMLNSGRADEYNREEIIYRDGAEVARVASDDLFSWFHHQHGYSMFHALEHEGYSHSMS